MTPADVLLLRAISHFERAQLELGLAQTSDGTLKPVGSVQSAAQWIEKGLALVREVVER